MSQPLTLPTLFLSHGSPMLALEEELTTQFLRNISVTVPRPDAILIASAHWETTEPMVMGNPHPSTIHDFHGFPKELYALKYPAPGNPVLAEEVRTLLAAAGLNARIDPARGFDHGAWNPLLLMYPQADIPVIELSVQPQRDARWHYNIGKALAPLRQKSILIIGTGNLTHNLREAFRGHAETPAWVTGFVQWIAERIAEDDIDSLLDWQTLAPHARENHPTPEHFLPLFIALGAAGVPLHAKHLHEDTALGVLAMDAYAFG
jgi:4,5-DOPA dioxygenase extradiol